MTYLYSSSLVLNTAIKRCEPQMKTAIKKWVKNHNALSLYIYKIDSTLEEY